MKNIGFDEILKPFEMNDLIQSHDAISEDQTMTFFDFNVPDSMSLPTPISKYIEVKDIHGTYGAFRPVSYDDYSGVVPYKYPNTLYYERWINIENEFNNKNPPHNDFEPK